MGAPKKYATDEERQLAINARSKARRRANRVDDVGLAAYRRANRRNMRKRYGIDPDAAEEAMANNDGTCDSCHAPLAPGNGTHVDHDHAAPGELVKPRGILCPGCNQALGNINDSIPRLRALIEYLERTT